MFQLLQQMTRPHIDSFNYMLTTGLSDAIKVCCLWSAFSALTPGL